MNPKQKKWTLIIGVLIVLWVIGKMLPEGKQDDTAVAPSNTYTPAAAPESGTTHTKWDAYGICTQIARGKYGKADFSFDEAWDYGNDNWMVRGFADMPGKRITWTGEVQYSPKDGKWEIKGWTDNQ